MKNGKIKTLEIKIFKSKNDNIAKWAYVVVDVQSEKFFTLNKKYIKKIFGKDCFNTLYKVDARTSKNAKGYKDLQILHVHGTYVPV